MAKTQDSRINWVLLCVLCMKYLDRVRHNAIFLCNLMIYITNWKTLVDHSSQHPKEYRSSRSAQPHTMKFKLGSLVWFMLQIWWILQSAPPNLFGICFFRSLSWSTHGVAMAMSHNFSFAPSSDDFFSIFNISIVPSSEAYFGATTTLDNAKKTVWLIPHPNETQNHNWSSSYIVYEESIKVFTDTSNIVSFNASFSFHIITQANLSGEGMAFFIAQDKAFPHASAGSYLGLSNDTFINSTSPGHNFFAIEFDIAQSPEFDDPSSSHIGIDINSLQSIQTVDTSGDNNELSLHQDFRFQTWITFNASTNMVQVWFVNPLCNFSWSHTWIPKLASFNQS